MAFRFVFAAVAVSAALVSLPTVAQVPPSLEQKAQNLRSDLTAKGSKSHADNGTCSRSMIAVSRLRPWASAWATIPLRPM